MGLERTYYIICGIRMSEDEFRKRFGNPSESELPGRLVAVGGGEADVDGKVLGRVVQKMDRYGEVPDPKDLTALREHHITVANELEQMGILLRDEPNFPDQPRLYSVVSVR